MSKARELSKLPNYVLSTVAELKLTVGKEQGDKAFVGGYYADGDGGGGDFYWDAVSIETDNGGTILQVTGTTTGRWKRIYSDSVNVKWFGAVGDGVTDDTTVFANVITAVVNNEIYIPNGDYALNYLDLGGLTGLTIRGESQKNTVLKARTGWTGLLNNNGDKCFVRINNFYGDNSTPNYYTYSTSSYLTIENITISEDTVNNTLNTVGVYVSRTTYSKFRNFRLVGFDQTLKLCHSWILSFSDGDIRTSYTHNLVIDSGQLNGVSFNDIDFSTGRSVGTINQTTSACVKLKEVTRVYFNTCYFEGTSVYAFDLYNFVTLNLHGCTAEFYNKTLIFVNGSESAINLSNCMIPNTILADTVTTSIAYFLNANGCSFGGSTIKGFCKGASIVGWSFGTATYPSMVMDYKLDKLCKTINIQFSNNAKMIAWNIQQVSQQILDVYGSHTPSNTVTTSFTVPKNFIGKKYILELESLDGQDISHYNAVKFVARYKIDGGLSVGEEIPRVYQSVLSTDNADTKLWFQSLDITTGTIVVKITKLGAGYVESRMKITSLFTLASQV